MKTVPEFLRELDWYVKRHLDIPNYPHKVQTYDMWVWRGGLEPNDEDRKHPLWWVYSGCKVLKSYGRLTEKYDKDFTRHQFLETIEKVFRKDFEVETHGGNLFWQRKPQ